MKAKRINKSKKYNKSNKSNKSKKYNKSNKSNKSNKYNKSNKSNKSKKSKKMGGTIEDNPYLFSLLNQIIDAGLVKKSKTTAMINIIKKWEDLNEKGEFLQITQPPQRIEEWFDKIITNTAEVITLCKTTNPDDLSQSDKDTIIINNCLLFKLELQEDENQECCKEFNKEKDDINTYLISQNSEIKINKTCNEEFIISILQRFQIWQELLKITATTFFVTEKFSPFKNLKMESKLDYLNFLIYLKNIMVWYLYKIDNHETISNKDLVRNILNLAISSIQVDITTTVSLKNIYKSIFNGKIIESKELKSQNPKTPLRFPTSLTPIQRQYGARAIFENLPVEPSFWDNLQARFL